MERDNIKKNFETTTNAEKKKSKRRSRHIEEGRDFKCDCGKAYLSETALMNHKIQKHNLVIQEKRGKGRPRKNVIVNILKQAQTDLKVVLENQQKIFENFFKEENRCFKDGNDNSIKPDASPEELKKNFISIFEEQFQVYDKKLFEGNKSCSDHNLYKLIKQQSFLSQGRMSFIL